MTNPQFRPAPVPENAPQLRDQYVRNRLGDLLAPALAGHLVRLPSSAATPPSFRRSVHLCFLDKECRFEGVPSRIHWSTRKWFWTLHLTPEASLHRWLRGGFLSRSIPSVLTCRSVVSIVATGGPSGLLLRATRQCDLRRDHRGSCHDWEDDTFHTRSRIVLPPSETGRAEGTLLA